MWTTKNWWLYARILQLSNTDHPAAKACDMDQIVREAVFPDRSLVWC